MATTEKLLTLTQAAERFGISPGTLRKWADNGHVRCIRLPSGYRRFTAIDIDKDLERMGMAKAVS